MARIAKNIYEILRFLGHVLAATRISLSENVVSITGAECGKASELNRIRNYFNSHERFLSSVHRTSSTARRIGFTLRSNSGYRYTRTHLYIRDSKDLYLAISRTYYSFQLFFLPFRVYIQVHIGISIYGFIFIWVRIQSILMAAYDAIVFLYYILFVLRYK